MELLIIILLDLVAIMLITIEGRHTAIGALGLFLISVLFTPLVGLLVVLFGKKRITFHHYVKMHTANITGEAMAKRIHRNGKDYWIEIKSSELNLCR